MTTYLQHKNLANTRIDAARARQIKDGVHRTLDRLRKAEEKAGRPAGSVTLLAATKTRDAGEIYAALTSGVSLIGENRPQEIAIKTPALQRLVGENPRLSWPEVHLIGQLQKNKINKVLPLVSTIESVESAKQARDIATRVPGRSPTGRVRILLEVNESGETSKSGCAPAAAYGEALSIAHLSRKLGTVELAGLMTIGAHTGDEKRVRAGFAALRNLRERILSSREPGSETCQQLSMGMTGDLPLAVAEGSTQVRVGTGIFGPREFI